MSESAAKRCAHSSVINRQGQAITWQGYQSKASNNMIGVKLRKDAWANYLTFLGGVVVVKV